MNILHDLQNLPVISEKVRNLGSGFEIILQTVKNTRKNGLSLRESRTLVPVKSDFPETKAPAFASA